MAKADESKVSKVDISEMFGMNEQKPERPGGGTGTSPETESNTEDNIEDGDVDHLQDVMRGFAEQMRDGEKRMSVAALSRITENLTRVLVRLTEMVDQTVLENDPQD